MQRIGFLIQVRPEKLEDYKAQHAAVWPELLAELKAAGISNYSLFLRPDGLEFGYLECEDWKAACDYLTQSEVNTRWQEFMRDYLQSAVGEETGQPIEMLQQVFFLA
jgi:L-rhamnose mutarotase